jgi:three-Cys-motif partner protein
MSSEYLFPVEDITATEPIKRFPRLHGQIWTHRKSLLIKLYLDLFVKVTFRGTYIDAFAGPQEENEFNPENWSAKRLWEANPGSNRKRIDKFELFEQKPKSVKRLKNMVSSTSKDKRSINIHEGDANILVPAFFKERTPKGPTFCLLDQRSVECHWDTVKQIASYKIKDHKPEIFYFLMASWKDRSLAKRLQCSPEEIAKWWGKDDIQTPKDLTTEQLGAAFTEKFKKELGYKYAYSFPIWDNVNLEKKGKTKFFMIHASDHDAATNLMFSAYNKLGSGYNPKAPKTEEFQWSKDEMKGALSKVDGWDGNIGQLSRSGKLFHGISAESQCRHKKCAETGSRIDW